MFYNIKIKKKYLKTMLKNSTKISKSLNCYMNSLIKCLYYIKELREYLILYKDNFSDQQPICKIMSNIMYMLKYNATKYFEATKLQEIIGDNNDILVGGKAGDSNCIFTSIIDSFLNELSYSFIKHNNNYTPGTTYNQSNKKEVFEIVCNSIDKNNIINQLFLGYYETVFKCENKANINIYSFQNEYYINFDLENICKYYDNVEDIKISQCFQYYYGREKETQFFCDKCGTVESNICYEKIYKPPLILVIILNRGNNNNFDGIVIPEGYLDLSNYIDGDGYKNGNECLYTLIALPTKYGACCMTDSGIYFDSKTIAMEIRESQLNRDTPFLMIYRRNDN
jgi:ubiquitin C-terminal hydrolase